MNSLKTNCNACGNLLEINQFSNYVTCYNCNSLLEIVKTETSYFTIEKEVHTNQKSRKEKKRGQEKSNSHIYTEIEMLDREWNNSLPNFMVKGTLPDTNGLLHRLWECL